MKCSKEGVKGQEAKYLQGEIHGVYYNEGILQCKCRLIPKTCSTITVPDNLCLLFLLFTMQMKKVCKVLNLHHKQ